MNRLDPIGRFSLPGVLVIATLLLAILQPPFRQAAGRSANNPVTLVSAASIGGTVAPDSIATLYGINLATRLEVATGLPLPFQLAGTTVEIGGKPAQLFYVAPGQINCLIPSDVATGPQPVVVRSGDGAVSNGMTQISLAAPGIFTADASGAGLPAAQLLRFRNGNQQRDENLGITPIDLGPESDQVFLILYLTGLRRATNNVRMLLGNHSLPVQYAGPSSGPGLDQINVLIPRTLIGRGKINAAVKIGELFLSNEVQLNVGGLTGTTGAPQVSSLETTEVSVGEPIAIIGSNFSPERNKNIVRIGDAEASVVDATGGRLRARVPYGATTSVVTVINERGEEGRSSVELKIRTSLSGFIEDTRRQPISGVTVKLRGTNFQAPTDAEGLFSFKNLPNLGSFVEIEIDPSSAQQGTLPFPKLILKKRFASGRDNFLDRIPLQQDSNFSVQVGAPPGQSADPDTTHETAAAPEQAGFARQIATGGVIFTVPADTPVQFPDGAARGQITMTMVAGNRTPVSLPATEFVSSVVQLTPFTTTLQRGGKLSFPNSEGLPPGTPAKLYRFVSSRPDNPNSESGFIVEEAGQAKVSADGLHIETAMGAITSTSYYFVSAPRKATTIIGRVVDSDERTPVRGALVLARGQSAVTDGDGGFVLRQVLVNEGESIAVEAGYLRPNGRVVRGQISDVFTVVNGITTLARPISLTAEDSSRGPIVLAPSSLVVSEAENRTVDFLAVHPDGGQILRLEPTGTPSRFITVSQVNSALYRLMLGPKTGDRGEYKLLLTATDNRSQSATYEVELTVNGRPIARPLVVTTTPGQTRSFILTGEDPEGLALEYIIVEKPANGTLTINGPNCTYTPNPGFTSNDRIIFRVSDALATSTEATVTILVSPVNRPPVLSVPGPQTVAIGASLKFLVTATDPDANQTLTFSAIGRPGGSSFTQIGNTSAEFNWTPNASQAGNHTVTFEVSDNGAPTPLRDTKTVTITVNSVNRPPVANPQTVTTNEDTSVNVTLTGSDPDGNPLTYTIVDNPTNGSLSGSGALRTYTPRQDFNGTDSFSFKVSDGSLESNVATVTLNVNPVNDAPVLTVPGPQSVDVGRTVNFAITASDIDAGQTLTLSATNLPTGASFTQTSNTSGQFTWTPSVTQTGNHTVTFTVFDNGTPSLNDSKSVTIAVNNRAPVANPQSLQTDEDLSVNLTLTGSDPDGNPLTYIIVNQPANGSLSGSGALRTYTPNLNFNGTDSFTFRVNDGALDSNTATVMITINPVNDAPVLTVPGTQSVSTGQLLSFTVTASDVDVGQALTLTATNLPSGASFTQTSPTNGQFSWTPGITQTGNFAVTFIVADNGSPALSDSKIVTIAVNNRTPVANPQFVSTNEDTPVNLTLTGSDPDGNPLTYIIVNQPANGSLSGSGALRTYTPNLNFNGTDSFTFKVNDGALDSSVATVTITINPVNDAPLLTVPGPQSVGTGQLLSFTVTASDVDAGQTLTLSALNLPSGAGFTQASATSGQFSWTPGTSQTGNYTVTFIVTDNGNPSLNDSKNVTIAVNNRAPSANPQAVSTNEDTPVNLTLTGSDPDGNPLTYIIVNQPANGSLSGSDALRTYTPNLNFNGTDSFTFKVNDGALDSNTATVMITINPVNDAPVLTVPGTQIVSTGQPLSFTVMASDVDADQTLTLSALNLPSGAGFTQTSAVSGQFTWTPSVTQTGNHTITFTVFDNGNPSLNDSKNVTIAVNNRAPSANPQAVSTNEDTPVNLTLTGSDPDGNPLTYIIVNQPTNGSLSGSGALRTYTPNLNFNGTDSFTFKVNDGALDSNTVTVTITINPVNDAPLLIVPGAQSVTAGQALSFAVTANDVDVGQALTLTATNLPSAASFVQTSATSGQFTWIPSATQAGNYTVTFRVTDNGSPVLSDSKTVSITVNTTANPVPTLTSLSPGAATAGGADFTLSVNGTNFVNGAIVRWNGSNRTTNFISGAQLQAVITAADIATAGAASVTVFNPTPGGGTSNALSFTINAALACPTVSSFTPTGGVVGSSVLLTGANFTGITSVRFANNVAATFAVNSNTQLTAVVPNGAVTGSITLSKAGCADVQTGIFTVSQPNPTPTLTSLSPNAALAGGLAFTLTVNGANFVNGSVVQWNGSGRTTTFVSATQLTAQIPASDIAAAGTANIVVFNPTPGGGLSNALAFTIASNDLRWAQTAGPTGGAIVVLLGTGTHLYAGTRSGIFRSSDNGTNWTALNDDLINVYISALAVRGTTLFAGSYGRGVFRSSDNGASWTEVNTGLTNPLVTALTVSGTTIFAGTGGGGVFRSTDNGANWTAVNNGLSNTDIRAFAVSGTHLFAGTGDGVFRSSDNGANWAAANSGLTAPEVYALVMGGTNLYAGTGGGVFRSSDNGASWTAVNAGLGGAGIIALAVNGTNIFGGTSGGIIRSSDNGESWVPANDGLSTTYVTTLAVNGTTLLAGTFGGGVFRSTNNGAGWTAINTGLNNTDVRALTASGTNLFAGTNGSGVFRSSDGGASWTAINNSLNSTEIYALVVSGANLFAGTGSNGIFRSSNNGASWTAVNSGLGRLEIRALAVSGTTLFAGTIFGGGVFRSTNNGTTWTAVNTGLSNTNVQALAVSGTTLFAGTTGGVFRSSDSGATWAAVNTGLSNTNVQALAVSGTTLLAGTTGGVFRSSDNGASWTPVNTGLSNTNVQALVVSGTTLFAATTGGVFRSSDNGASWTALNNGLTSIDVRALTVSGTKLFAGTSTRSVFVLDLTTNQ